MQTHTEIDATPAISGSVLRRAAGTATNHTVTTAYDPYAGRANSARLVPAIYLLFGLIAGFVRAVYAITDVHLAPFSGLFGTPQIATGAALEVSTPVALIVYAAVGWFLAEAGWLILVESRSTAVASVNSKQSHGWVG